MDSQKDIELSLIVTIAEFGIDSVSEQDRELFQIWIADKDHQIYFEKIKKRIIQESRTDNEEPAFDIFREEYFEYITKRNLRRRIIISSSSAAAVLAILLVIANFLMPPKSVTSPVVKTAYVSEGIKLITEDGESVDLNDTASLNTVLGSERVINANSTLDYSQVAKKTAEVEYHTLVIPSGKTYCILLSDGTKVWLNASSQLRYPKSFTNQTRDVYLTGEAFFDVTHSDKKFIVHKDDIEVKVYGTAFNVCGYEHGKTFVTLVRGKVGIKIPENNQEVMLNPNEMAEYNHNTKHCEIAKVDAKECEMWKEGYFYFNNKTLESIMAPVIAWYDIKDVQYERRELKEVRISGSIRSDKTLKEVMDLLRSTGLFKFRIVNNIIYIESPN